MAKIKGKTKSGFNFEISDSLLNDMEFFELLSQIDDNPIIFPKIVDKLLGKEQKEELYNHVRLKDGTVPVDKISDEIIEIFKVKEIKN